MIDLQQLANKLTRPVRCILAVIMIAALSACMPSGGHTITNNDPNESDKYLAITDGKYTLFDICTKPNGKKKYTPIDSGRLTQHPSIPGDYIFTSDRGGSTGILTPRAGGGYDWDNWLGGDGSGTMIEGWPPKDHVYPPCEDG
ncbi:MAG: hypothetical protein ABJ308_09730 [Halieaceae bacterium]